MNQIYFKSKYLFLLLGFLVSSAGMAQSPFQSTNKGSANPAIQTSVGNLTKEQVSKKTSDSNLSQNKDANNLFNQKEEKIKGKMLFMPSRIMITGEMHGPDLTLIMDVLGKAEVLNRIKSVASIMQL